MCTAATYKTKDFYFGRTLDYEISYGDEVVILAVNCMEDENTVNQFIKYNGYTFPIAYDVNGAISDLYPTDGIPYTLVIGTDGTVLRTFIGADSADVQYREYKSAIDAALQQ